MNASHYAQLFAYMRFEIAMISIAQFLLVGVLAAEKPTPASLSAAVADHQTKYLGLQFEYRAEYASGKDGKFVTTPDGGVQILEKGTSDIVTALKARETLRIKAPPDPGDPRIWRDWRQETQQGEGAGWTLTKFVVFNGEQTRLYKWLEPDEGVWSNGHILPYEDMGSIEENAFDRILHLDTHGQYQLSPNRPNPTPYSWEVTNTTAHLVKLGRPNRRKSLSVVPGIYPIFTSCAVVLIRRRSSAKLYII
jgi:hypothetical protein